MLCMFNLESMISLILSYPALQSTIGHLYLTLPLPLWCRLDKPERLTVTPSTPHYMQFTIPQGVNTVLVTATSNDSLCAAITVQNKTVVTFPVLFPYIHLSRLYAISILAYSLPTLLSYYYYH